MSYEKNVIENDINLFKLIDLIKYRRNFKKNHPQYFNPDGLIVYTGSQGSGKTLSACKYVCSLMKKYPCCKLVTNVRIAKYPIDNERVYLFNNADDLMNFNNSEFGVLYFIDEIQLYFSSLDSKNIDPSVLVEISQQRKQRKHIVATSQVFGRLAKPLREQFNTVVLCRNFFSGIQVNKYLRQQDIKTDDDYMHLEGRTDKLEIFVHSSSLYRNYDTYAKIKNLKRNKRDVKGGSDLYDYFHDSAGND